MKSNREKVSYCIGLETAKNLTEQFKDLDLDLLQTGFKDALEERTPQLEQEEIKTIMETLQQQVYNQQKAYVNQLAEENKKQGETFLEENKSSPDVTVLPSGLQYKIIARGSGEGASPTMMDVVTCHYRASFIDGKVFDSTYEKGKPQSFPMSRIIPGWSEALKLMKVGDKWQLFVPYYLAYGEQGYGPQIQPNMTLVFEMELISIN